jgi:excinuclease UvrABC ATPase subunit
MKKIIMALIALTMIVLVAHVFAQEFEFIGAGKCKMCHKSEKRGAQYPKWEERKHSKSFQVLSQDIAQPKAEEAGLENPSESPECLKCHGPLYDAAPEFKEEGVTCEVCHGPGSEYKSLSVMKDHEKSVAKGVIEYNNQEDIKKQCLTCHDNAHGTSFDFGVAWEKVKHYRPDK